MHDTARMILIKQDFYYTVSGPVSREIKIKGSRFISALEAVSDRLAAESFIKNIRKRYHDASHNCFAYRIDDSLHRYSDDGEPSGTAGRPILDMVDKYQLIKTVLVVTRYFGGAKLGTGGLIRAYSSSAESLIKSAKIIKKPNFKPLHIHYPYEMTSKVQRLVQKYNGRIEQESNERGIIARIEIIPSKLQEFINLTMEITAAKAVIIRENGD
jgi:uncharacterized YigZ family protein